MKCNFSASSSLAKNRILKFMKNLIVLSSNALRSPFSLASLSSLCESSARSRCACYLYSLTNEREENEKLLHLWNIHLNSGRGKTKCFLGIQWKKVSCLLFATGWRIEEYLRRFWSTSARDSSRFLTARLIHDRKKRISILGTEIESRNKVKRKLFLSTESSCFQFIFIALSSLRIRFAF